MSSVIVNVGQCGNQIGQAVLDQLIKDKRTTEQQVYVNAEGKSRSVHIDSEPKVVNRLLRESQNGLIREKNVVLGRRGRGSNWAMGYYGNKSEDNEALVRKAVEATRKEIERCHSFSGTILVHSISGGTGSGLGSKLAEVLRDEFPMHYQLSCVVAPHAAGETPLQYYNALMTHAWLQRHCDGVVLFQNDEIMTRLEKQGTMKEREKGVSLDRMNKHIAACFGGVILPTDTLTAKSGVSIGLEPWEMIRAVCPMPTLKYINLNTTSRNKLAWDGMAGAVVSGLQKYSCHGDAYSSIANLVVARGDNTNMYPVYRKEVEQKISKGYHCVSWNPFPVDSWTCHSNCIGPKGTASMTVAANHSSVIDHLQQVVNCSRTKLQARAYLHWYQKYGMETDDFEEAFDTVEGILSDYNEAIR